MIELMITGARKVVNVCAGVKPDETVVIVTDPEREKVAKALAIAVTEAGASVAVVSTAPNRFDGQEPHPIAIAAMAEADVVLAPVTRSISHSKAVKQALGRGARVLSLAKFEDAQLVRGGILADFEKEKVVCDAFAERFGRAGRLHLTSAGGTDLKLDITGRPGNSHPCVARNPGEFTAIVNIEANVAPVEGSANGVIVVDGSIPNFDIGPVRQPITLQVADGRVIDITGGIEASVLSRILESFDDPEAYNIAQVAVGLNPECRDFNGWFLNEHGVYGSAHIGIGTSENLGGSTRAPVHFDVMMYEPTLRLDDEVVLSQHRIRLD